ncbi:hypothetical protein F5Y12DRAFT_739436 [Xylaria sp. FL1777]|nr:hypothetical protein F5Y12DRAFT_739436 [Xylaria sp. FL1777]
MARVKYDARTLRMQRARITWTRFRLPRDQAWPKWSEAYPDTYLGPLANAPGCKKVSLGTKVEIPEQAAFIIHWESADALEAFRHSPLCGEFLQSLGRDDDDADESLLSLQYASGFWIDAVHDELSGRITLNRFKIPFIGAPDRRSWLNTILTAFGSTTRFGSPRGFMPKGCEDLRGPPAVQYKAFAWVDDGQEQTTIANTSPNMAICFLFWRWNCQGASTEREEASVKEPGAHELWAETVAKAMPPVETWEQERWDIEIAPCYIRRVDDEEEEEEEEDTSDANARMQDMRLA